MTAEGSSEELVRRALAGDEDACAAVCERAAQRMRIYFAGKRLDRASIDDAVQDCVTRLVAAIRRQKLRPDRVEHWCAVVARNVWVDGFRRPPLQTAPTPHDIASDTDNPLRGAARNELAVRLRDAVSALPDHLRVAIELQLAGSSYARIATTLGISRTAVGKRLFEARKRLASLLDE